MKTYGGVDVYIHVFLTSVLVGGEWSASRPCRFTPKKRRPGTHWIEGWVGPQSRSERYREVKILDPTGTRTPTSSMSSPFPVAIPTALPRNLEKRRGSDFGLSCIFFCIFL
jgi:hypothetical protein